MARRGLYVCVIAAAIAALPLAVIALGQGSLGTQPIAGATYTGTVSGGGNVSLTVSAGGTELAELTYSISGSGCAVPAALSGLAVPIDDGAFTYEESGLSFSGSFLSPGAAEGTIETTASPPCDSGTWTATTSATPVPSPTPTPTPSPTLTPGQMHNCPEAGNWSIATWGGQNAIPIGEALAFCSQQVDVAYHINPETQAWARYFRGRPEISNLTALDDCQGVITLGSGVSVASSASDERLEAAANANRMLGCPLPGKWAIAVWDGDDGTDAEEALATCGEDAVAVAYSIDPHTQAWSRWFDGRPEISNMLALGYKQGVLALGGGAGAPVNPTASPTRTPTPGPTRTPTLTPTPAVTGGPPTDYLDTFHATLDLSMEMDDLGMNVAIEGDFEATDSCSCDLSASMGGMPLVEERVIVIGNSAWIDTGDGWRNTTPSDPEVVEAAGMCPACPSFWEDLAFEVPPLAGEHEDKNGVPATHYTLEDLYPGLAGIGPIPEDLEGVSIDALDLWVAEDGEWLVCLDAVDMCVEGEALEQFMGSLGEEVESVCITMGIDITKANDPSIRVNAP